MRRHVGFVAVVFGRVAITMSIPLRIMVRIPSGGMKFKFVGNNDSIAVGFHWGVGWGIVVVSMLIGVWRMLGRPG